jgi:hypothetical protein
VALGYPNRKSDSYQKTAGYSIANSTGTTRKTLQNAVINLIGITGITNNINVITASKDVNRKEYIEIVGEYP